MKYAHSAISSVVAHRFNGVSAMIADHKAGSFTTQSFNGVRTPPGSRLLHVAPYSATLSATFFVYAITPPLLAQYSGNSEPVWPLADQTLRMDLMDFCTPYFSVTLISDFRLISMSSSF